MAAISFTGGKTFFLIAGPCVIESEEHVLRMAQAIQAVTDRLGIPLIFKSSFDKANRTSLHSYRGPGLEKGLAALRRVKEQTGLPVLTDVHEVWQVEPVAQVCDVLQIPAFLCRQTDLLVAAGRSGAVVNIKKGQFVSPQEMRHAIDKVRTASNEVRSARSENAGGKDNRSSVSSASPASSASFVSSVLVTERGTSFGYNNLVVDMRSLPILRSIGCPVVLDITHSVQLPGGAGQASGGQPEFIEPLARAGVAVGVDGLFVEVHDNPAAALSDGANALPLAQLQRLLERLIALDHVVRPWL